MLIRLRARSESGEAVPHEQRSLFGEILDWMLAPLLLLWPMSVALTWLVAQNIAARPYDRDLGQLTRMVAQQMQGAAALESRQPTRLPEAAAALLRSDDVDRIYFQVQDDGGRLVAGDREIPTPEGEPGPYNEVQFRDDLIQGEPVRVALLRLPAGDEVPSQIALVQVAETLDKRSRLATEIIKGVILPQFVILPLAVLLVWFALARGIAPLNQLQQRIRRRESHDLSPIDEHDAPEEVAPLVRSINDLLARLDTSMGSQKHFLADAAHQLKTPLAGLRTQAELAQREIDASGDVQSVRRSLQQIALSSQRAAHMVNQLLAMARAEDKEQALRLKSFDLVALATETVLDFVPKAMDKRIDLGYEGPVEGESVPLLLGQPILVRELVRNLVDNALQYTPAGGTVTVRVTPDPFGQVMVLQVEDNGPGIPEAERELVFQPFYRALGTNVDGSGLGLAIVKEIADKHEASLEITAARTPTHPEDRPGAQFTVRFPLRPLEAGTPAGPQASEGAGGPA
ncbi:sensor histidine kinase N-terminal domain-containing protein [Ideonella livida]|uniref:histidine kinase n=1 Tax=Ideonella livida TaxID=2707176 RepID=A0A7C9PG45_9BURK|nr:sensor histidine kinase N-terminal domain-containing protein [Ideonella livida]NDY91033.1 sensor histidine kinase [Ideonella livida]